MKRQRFDNNVCAGIAVVAAFIVFMVGFDLEQRHAEAGRVHIVNRLGGRVVGDFWVTNQPATVRYYEGYSR
jgi:hypothetical protein